MHDDELFVKKKLLNFCFVYKNTMHTTRKHKDMELLINIDGQD